MLGGLLIFMSGVMDIFDGAMARKMNLITDKGAFLDSTFDRLSESIILVGLIYFFSKENELNAVILASLTLACEAWSSIAPFNSERVWLVFRLCSNLILNIFKKNLTIP